MPRGGYRPGSGRPRGALNLLTREIIISPAHLQSWGPEKTSTIKDAFVRTIMSMGTADVQERPDFEARSLPDHIPFDATGLPMAIWV